MYNGDLNELSSTLSIHGNFSTEIVWKMNELVHKWPIFIQHNITI